MGFDEFIDQSHFKVQKTGQYVGDLDVLEKIKMLFNNNEHTQPLFVFVITMENHGPLHLEKPTADDQKFIRSNKHLEKLDDLLVYLKHLKNADRMVGRLRKMMQHPHISSGNDGCRHYCTAKQPGIHHL